MSDLWPRRRFQCRALSAEMPMNLFELMVVALFVLVVIAVSRIEKGRSGHRWLR